MYAIKYKDYRMNRDELYALSCIKGVGPKAVSAILDYLHTKSIDTLRSIDLKHLLEDKKLSRYKKVLSENLPWDIFEKYIEEAQNKIHVIEQKGIEIISIADEDYPKLLKMTQDAPVFLYCKGNLSLLNNSNNVAVVGTRQNTQRGKLITEKSVQFLCSNKYTIVSGLALGIDAIAHQEALNNKGKTISVLVDVDNVQPTSNRALADQILADDGLLIAEESPGIRIIPSMFAKRDRIQSGLSLAVFPIETSIDGGTMHAVNNAIKENRLVYTPDISKSGYTDKNIPQLEGIRYLIEEDKATPYTIKNYDEILMALKSKQSELFNPPPILQQGSLL